MPKAHPGVMYGSGDPGGRALSDPNFREGIGGWAQYESRFPRVQSGRHAAKPQCPAWAHEVVESLPAVAPSPAKPSFALRWPRVADDLFFLAHNDRSGSLLMNPANAGIGLGAALLGELLLTKWITMTDELVKTTYRPGPALGDRPTDALSTKVLNQIWDEPQPLGLDVWLAFLARESYDLVAQRMVDAGNVSVPRLRLSLAAKYPPTDVNRAAAPWVNLTSRLRRGDRLEQQDLLLGGLCLITDLHRTILATASEHLGDLRQQADDAPEPLSLLLDGAAAAISDAVARR